MVMWASDKHPSAEGVGAPGATASVSLGERGGGDRSGEAGCLGVSPQRIQVKRLIYEVLGSCTADSTYPDAGSLVSTFMEPVVTGAG